jgi:hypothetical protein
MPVECPTAELLAAFLEHALTEEELEAVEHHMVSCWTCREALKESLSIEDGEGGGETDSRRSPS